MTYARVRGNILLHFAPTTAFGCEASLGMGGRWYEGSSFRMAAAGRRQGRTERLYATSLSRSTMHIATLARHVATALAAASTLAAAACSASPEAERVAPATVHKIEPNLSLVELTEAAASGIGVETAPVVEETFDGVPRLVVPYQAVLYHTGGAWIYTSSRQRAYVQTPVEIERIEHADIQPCGGK